MAILKLLGHQVMPRWHWEAYVRNMGRAEAERDCVFTAARRVLSIIETDFSGAWSTGVPAEALADLKIAVKGFPECVRVMEPDISDEAFAEWTETYKV